MYLIVQSVSNRTAVNGPIELTLTDHEYNTVTLLQELYYFIDVQFFLFVFTINVLWFGSFLVYFKQRRNFVL